MHMLGCNCFRLYRDAMEMRHIVTAAHKKKSSAIVAYLTGRNRGITVNASGYGGLRGRCNPAIRPGAGKDRRAIVARRRSAGRGGPDHADAGDGLAPVCG